MPLASSGTCTHVLSISMVQMKNHGEIITTLQNWRKTNAAIQRFLNQTPVITPYLVVVAIWLLKPQNKVSYTCNASAAEDMGIIPRLRPIWGTESVQGLPELETLSQKQKEKKTPPYS